MKRRKRGEREKKGEKEEEVRDKQRVHWKGWDRDEKKNKKE